MAAIKIFSLLLLIFFHVSISSAQPAPSYSRFTFDATLFPPESDYDYVIVGGGTTGCPLAATLSSAGYRVLLLERGGAPHEFPTLATTDGFLQTLTLTQTPDSPAQAFTSEDGVPNARGRVLGGSSAINAGFYSRAHVGFYQDSGVNWDLDLVDESYEWVEGQVAFRPELRDWQSAVRDGLIEANVTPYNGYTVHHVGGTKIGASTFDGNGRRHSAADLLAFGSAENLRVATRASVDRILLNSNQNSPSSGGPRRRRSQQQPTAIGVIFRDRLGSHHHAMTNPGGEVILCAGALGSPQLLLLSGIGPRPYLSSWGIPVAVHNPNVGQYLQDNPRNGISILPSTPVDHSLIQVVGITNTGAFLEAASNIISFRTPFSSSASPVYLTVATVIEKVAEPTSVGSLRLASVNARDNPIVRFNYFATQHDVDTCVVGVRKVADVLESRAMDGFRMWWRDFRIVGAALPLNRSDDAAVADFCRRTVSTIWHYHGGCLVGKVVDAHYRVVGVNGLRVVDGSTFAVSPGTNPQATLMMMGRYMGLKIHWDKSKKKV